MPTIRSIVKEALEIALINLQIEPLMRERAWNKVLKNTKFRSYHNKVVSLTNYADIQANKIATLTRSKESKVVLTSFKPLERELLEIVCKIHRVDVNDCIRLSRGRDLVDARTQYSALLRLQFYYTLRNIGDLLHKDHSTIIHSINKHKNLFDSTGDYKNKYIKILNEIESIYPGLLKTTLNPNIPIILTMPVKTSKLVAKMQKDLNIQNEKSN